jgi:hypothetical protein
MKKTGDRVEAVLLALLPAVCGIHGGCIVCLDHWEERANKALSDLGVPWCFEVHRERGLAEAERVTLSKVGETPT